MVTSPRPGWSGPGPVSSPAHARLRGLRTTVRRWWLPFAALRQPSARHRAAGAAPAASAPRCTAAKAVVGKFEPSVPFVPGRPVAPPLVPLPAKPPVPGAVAAVAVTADAGVATVAAGPRHGRRYRNRRRYRCRRHRGRQRRRTLPAGSATGAAACPAVAASTVSVDGAGIREAAALRRQRSRAGASLPFLRVIRAVRTGSGLSVRVLGVDGKDIAVGTVAAG